MTEIPPETACDGWDNSACEGTPLCPARCPRFIDSEGFPVPIKPFDETDMSRLMTMYMDLDEDQQTMGLPPVSRGAIETWLGSLTEEGWNLVALVEDRIVGHMGVAPATAHEPQFVVFVHQAYQNRGIGTELVKQLIAYAADREYEALRLNVTPDNEQAIKNLSECRLRDRRD